MIKISRKRGSKDRKKRKRRSDRKRWITPPYYKPFPKVEKGHKTALKLWIWEVRPMTREGRLRWDRKLRVRLHPMTYHPLFRVDSPVERINSIEAIKEFALEVIGYDGVFLIKGFSHGKNKRHIKNVTLARVKIKQMADGLMAFVDKTQRLSRYWFWRKWKCII